MNKHSGVKMNETAGLRFRICLWVLMVCLCLAVLPGSVFAQTPIDTIANPAGTTLDLFNYSVYSGNSNTQITTLPTSGGVITQEGLSTGINENHRFKFVQNHWALPISQNGHRWYWDHDETHWMNFFTGSANPSEASAPDHEWTYSTDDLPAYTNGYPNQDIVQRCLSGGCNVTEEHGYPVLVQSAGGESLEYLFNTASSAGGVNYNTDSRGRTKREVYPSTNNLLMVDDDGYYFFDSNYEKAQLDTTTDPTCVANGGCSFIVRLEHDWDTADDRDRRPNFLPFRDINDTRTAAQVGDQNPENFFLGMHMQVAEFSIPQNGEVVNPYGEKKPMSFEFHGDDDVWVFIDGVLVGDVGGIHWEEDLFIDFKSGKITICNHDHQSDTPAAGDSKQCTETTIRARFEAVADLAAAQGHPINFANEFDGDTFKERTYHTLDFFYLERGANPSNLYIRYNLISTYDFTSHKTLLREGVEDLDLELDRNDFHFRLTGYLDNPSDPNDAPPAGADAPIMPQEQPDQKVDWVKMYDPEYPGQWVLEVGNSADGNVNFGSGEVENSQLPDGTKFYYKYEELPPTGATLNDDGVSYTYHGRTVTANPDGTYTFGNMVYDLRPVYFTGTKNGTYLQKAYYEDPGYTTPRSTYFSGFENAYGASGDFELLATKQVEDHDGINEDRTFEYTVGYTNHPNEAPLVRGLVHLTDNSPSTDILFGSNVHVSRRLLSELVARGDAIVTAYADPNADELIPIQWDVYYTVKEVFAGYKDIEPNTQVFNITVTVHDYDDGTLGCVVNYPTGGINFINTERQNKTVTVSGQKILQGRNLTADDKWTYTLTPLNGGPMPATGEVQNNMQAFSFGNIIFTPDHLGDCTMTAGVYTCTSKEYSYEVVETGSRPGVTNDSSPRKTFTVTVSLDTNGVLQAVTNPNPLALTFTNIYSANGSVPFEGTKRVVDTDGDTREARTFTFTLTPPTGAGLAVTRSITTYDSTNASPVFAPVVFDTINYSVNPQGKLLINGSGSGIDPDEGANYNTTPRNWTLDYKITEVRSTDNGMIPNTQGFVVRVKVTDNGTGELTTVKSMCEYNTSTAAACTPGDGVPGTDPKFAFLNTERKDLKVRISGTKQLVGRSLAAGDVWDYTISSEDPNAPLPPEHLVHNDINGVYTFGEITFTPQHLAGDGSSATYEYIVTESGNVPNVANAQGVKSFTIKLYAGDDGELKADVTSDNLYPEEQINVTSINLDPFINTYYVEGSTVLAASKRVMSAVNAGRELHIWPAGTESFSFTLEGVNDAAKLKIQSTTGTTQNSMQAEAIQSRPRARFDTFFFSNEDYEYLQDPNHDHYYLFRLTEDVPTQAQCEAAGKTYSKSGDIVTCGGVTYTTVSYDVMITLTEDANRKVVPTVYSKLSSASAYGDPVTSTDPVLTVGNFDNTYGVEPVDVTLQGRKHVIDADGKFDKTRSFTFSLYYASDYKPATADTPVQGTKAVPDKTISMVDGQTVDFSFGKITYTREIDPNNPHGSLPSLVDLNRATRSAGTDGSVIFTIRYILAEGEVTDKAIAPNEQTHEITVTVIDDGKGHLSASSHPDITTLLFENYEINDVQVPVSGIKYIPQRPLTNTDVWTYVLWSETDGAPLPLWSETENKPLPEGQCPDAIENKYSPRTVVCTTNSLALFDFGNITFTPQHLGDGRARQTYRYRVAEEGNVAGITNSIATPDFTVTLELINGTMIASVNHDPLPAHLTFTNNYNEPGTVVFEALKSMAGNVWPPTNPAAEFTFKLTAVNDPAKQKIKEVAKEGEDYIETAATQAHPNAVFSALRFTLTDFNSLPANQPYFHFTLEEVAPTSSECAYETRSDGNYCKGVKYDTDKTDIYVTLTQETGYVIKPHIFTSWPNGTEIDPEESGVYQFGPWENTYNPSPARITVNAWKTIEDKDGKAEDRTFIFELKYAADGTDATRDLSLPIRDGDPTAIFTFPEFVYDRTILTGLVNNRRASRTENSQTGTITWVIPYILTETADPSVKDMIYTNKSLRITVTVTDNGSGRLSAASDPVIPTSRTDEFTFTNIEREPVTIPVAGRKVLNGRNLQDSDKWTFILWSTTEGAPMPVLPSTATVTCPSDAPSGAVCVQNTLADFSFGGITFTAEQLGENGRAKTYHYFVKESSQVNVNHVNNSQAEPEFTVTVSVNPDGTLSVVSDPSGATALSSLLTFTNYFVAEDSVMFAADKDMYIFPDTEMLIWPAGTPEFTFSLTGTNNLAINKINALPGVTGGVLTSKATSAIPLARFTEIKFTQDDYAQMMQQPEDNRKYTFTLREVLPTEGGVVRDGVTYYKGVAYSEDIYNIEVTLVLESTGDITPHIYVVENTVRTEIPREDNIYKFGPFENIYNPDDVPVTIQASKEVIDADGNNEQREFTFHLDYAAGDQTDTKAADDYVMIYDGTKQNFEFPEIIYSRTARQGVKTVSLAELYSKGRATRTTNASGQLVWTIPYLITEEMNTDPDMMPNSQVFEVIVTVTDDGSGQLLAKVEPDGVLFEFINQERRNVEIPVAGLKYLRGRDLHRDDKWTYILTSETEGAPMPAQGITCPTGTPTGAVCVQNEYRNFDFGRILFTPAMLGEESQQNPTREKEYKYKVVEYKDPSEPAKVNGITNDETPEREFTVTVSLDERTGDFNAVASPSGIVDLLTFYNKYDTEGTGEIKVEKVLLGRVNNEWLESDSFEFTLTAVSGAPLPECGKTEEGCKVTILSNTENHTMSFGTIPYTSAGTYEYTITETKGSIPGVTYDTKEHTVTIILEDDGKGNLVAAPRYSLEKTETITNTYKPAPVTAQVKAKKVLQGRQWKSDDSFIFVITPLNNAPAPTGSRMITIKSTDTDYTKAFGTITYTEPGKYEYEVSEVRNGIGGIDYEDLGPKKLTVTVVDKTDGTLGASCDPEDFTQSFTNIYSFTPAVGEIRVTKNLTGRQWKAGDTFSFRITATADGTPMPSERTVTIAFEDDNITKSFGTIKFEKAGEYTYTVQETIPEDSAKIEGITYDENAYTVTIKVTDDGVGHMIADGTPLVQTVAVTNTYGDVGIGRIYAQKILDGREWKTGDSFSFTLTAENGSPMPLRCANESACTVTITDADSATGYIKSFGDINFTQTGTYIYTVTENIPADTQKIGGITYDQTEHTVIIRVKVNPETGAVEAEEGSSLEQTAAFTNTYAATGEGEIKVTKNFTGRAWSDADAFLFTITPKGDAPMPGGAQTVMVTNKSANYTESFGKITFTKAGEYSYTVKEFTGGVPGVTYDEQPERTVTFKVKDDGNGNLVADGTEPEQTLTFTNTYAAEGEAELKVRKELEGAGWPDGGSITFTLTATDGGKMPKECENKTECTVTLTAAGTDSFGEVTYTLDDAGKTYTYTVTEVLSGFGKGWAPAQNPVTVKVTVGADDRSGKLNVSCDPADFTAHFRNIFTPEPAEGEIKVRKDLQNRDWLASDSFEFTLEGMNGAPMPDKTQITIDSGSANYTESFGTITFEKAGIYIYAVTETKGRIPGVTYDENTHNVIITIKEVDGKLTADAGELEQTVEITNIYEASGTGTIRVSKRLEGNTWPTGGKIAFVLNGSNGAPMPDGSDGNTALLTAEGITDFGAITYGLENAGQVYTYTVTEYFSDEFGAGWTPAENPVTVKVTVGADDGSGNLAVSCDPQNFTAAFTNIYTAEGKAELKVKKELAGADWPEGGSINFTLTATDGGKMPKECENKTACTVTLNAAGTGSFGEVTYTLDDAGNTYTYTVTEELSGFSSSWAPAQNPVTIKVTVSADDGSGTLKVTCDPEDFSAHFKNIYTAIPAEGEIKVQKDLQNRAWKDGDSFSFTLAGLNGAPMPDVTQITISSRSADYTESFGRITFTEPGSYVYTVKETKGDLPGVTYDETEHTVVITITEADGRLTGDEAVLNQTVEVTNIYEASGTGTIRVSKELVGNTWPAGGNIAFILSGQNGAPMPDGSDGNSVQLTAAGTESFGAITYDLDDAGNVYTYTVKEFFSDEFGTGWAPEENPVTVTITVGADDGSGNLAVSCDPQDFTAAFTNIYTSEGKAELKVKKELSGAEWPSGGSITFTITGAGGAPMPANSTVTLTAPGTASFGEVTYNLADAGKTYTYSVTETLSGFSSGWAPAQNPVTMTVTVGADDGSGKLNVTCDPEDFTALITNIFTPEPIDGEISVSKNLSGREWKDGDSFTFTLAGLNNAPMPPVTQITIDNRTADHTASFGTIWFSDAGTYIYTVTEVKGNIEGVIYDESVHTVAIIVEKDSNGVLSAGAGTVLDPTVVITNTYVVTPVCVQFGGCKYFPGAPEDLQSTEFTYKLSRDGQIIDTATTRGAGGYQFTPFIYSEPGVYNYSVEEEIGDVYGIEYDKNKYNVTVTVERDDSTGVLTATVTDQQGQPFDSTHGMNFNNPYTASAQAYIEVRKTLRGAEWPAGGVVTFVLEGLDGAPMPANNTLRVTEPGVSSFAPISYGIECVGNTYQYNVTEVAEGFGGGWSMDPVSFPVSVTVTRAEDKTLHAEITYDLGNTVTNIFNNASIQFHGIKLFGGRRVPSNTFQFILEGSDGTYQIVSNNGAYFAFDTIWYKEAGEYTYTISEKVGRDGRIKYDDTVYTVTVTVVRDENDDLQIESITGDDIEMLVFRNDTETTPPTPPKFPPRLPETGFSAKHFTNLPEMPKDLNYKPLKMLLEIPSISVSEEIVSVPEINDEYPVTWLGEKIGALDGYAMPGKGNAYLTGHNHLNDMNAGPFAFLSWLEKGDRVFLNRGTEGVQIYSVYANEKIGEFDVDRMEEISAQFENSLTMITCEDEYEGGGGYSSRRIVAARPIGN